MDCAVTLVRTSWLSRCWKTWCLLSAQFVVQVRVQLCSLKWSSWRSFYWSSALVADTSWHSRSLTLALLFATSIGAIPVVNKTTTKSQLKGLWTWWENCAIQVSTSSTWLWAHRCLWAAGSWERWRDTSPRLAVNLSAAQHTSERRKVCSAGNLCSLQALSVDDFLCMKGS